VNPPTPDGGIWIRSQHRVGRRSRENMVWPQVSLAQLAALLSPTYSVKIVDANAERMDWAHVRADPPPRAAAVLRHAAHRADAAQRPLRRPSSRRPSGRSRWRFGTHITPMPRETLRPYPSLDFGLRGEPD
jgi:hypothetical protein